MQFDDNFQAEIGNHFWFRTRNGVLDRRFRTAARRGWTGKAPSVLEVGCGTGVVVRGLWDGHYRRYTRRTLRNVLVASGLEVAETRYVFRSLYVAAAMMKLSGRQRQPVMNAPADGRIRRALAPLGWPRAPSRWGCPLRGLSVLGVGLRPVA